MLPRSLFQALRNVWIANSLQMLFSLRLSLSPSLFAYSMLYPLTDNLLDDPLLSSRHKQMFGQRLGQRLSGDELECASAHEAKVHQMIEKIEQQYPRAHFGGVWGSLLAIHRAQIASLAQQLGANGAEAPREPALLALSLEKGGTSVLADGYLLTGQLCPEQEAFCFGYGRVPSVARRSARCAKPTGSAGM